MFNFDGYFKINSNNYGWWISYIEPKKKDNYQTAVVYFRNDETWDCAMGSYKFFLNKKEALDAFFEQFPDREIVDESEKLHVILRKGTI